MIKYWKTAKGDVIRIDEMNINHLRNAYRMTKRNFLALAFELLRRKLWLK